MPFAFPTPSHKLQSMIEYVRSLATRDAGETRPKTRPVKYHSNPCPAVILTKYK